MRLVMPDSLETRTLRLERQVATLEAELRAVNEDVANLEPVRERLTRIEEQMKQVREGLSGLQTLLADDRKAAKERGSEMARHMEKMVEQHARDMKAMQVSIDAFRTERVEQGRFNKAQIIAAVVAIVVALITVAGSIIATGGPS